MAMTSQLHKFTVDCYAVLDNGDSIDLNNTVNAIAIKKDFLNNIFPLYVLSFNLPDATRLKLIENEFYISLKIYRISISEFNSSDNAETTSSPTTDKIITSILLRPFDNSKIYQKQKTSDVENEDSEEVITNQYVSYTLNCVPKEQLRINNSVLNTCYNNANISECVLNLISDVYDKSIYFQESFNKTRYKSLLIPPDGLIASLKFLQENYMIYRYSLNMFFEYDKLYVYDLFDSTREFRNVLNIFVDNDPKSLNQEKYAQNFVDDDENIQKYLDSNPLYFSKKDINGYKYGDRTIISSYDENFNLVTRQYGASDTEDKKTRVVWNTEQNETFEHAYLNTINAFSQLSLSNFDPTYIEPDTMVIVSGSLQSFINGTYILSGMDIFFSSEDQKTFSNSTTCHLIKQNK